MKKIYAILVLFLISCLYPVLALNTEAKIMGRQDGSPYVYVRLIVSNPANRKIRFDIRIRDSYNKADIEVPGEEIDPGSEKVYNLALPLVRVPMIEVADAEGGRSVAGLSWENKFFLNICNVENWATEKQVQDFSVIYDRSRKNVVSQMEPDQLPDNWLCYAPFQSVFIRESVYNRIKPGEKESLLQWVNSGGDLVIYDTDKSETIHSMLGRIRYQWYNPIADVRDADGKKGLPNWQSNYKSKGSLKDFPYVVQKHTGKYGGFVLATIFLLVAGPINYIYFRTKKRIRWLLVSLPVISLGFCFLIIVYFITTQGFAKKGGSVSISFLDEKKDAGFTFSRHSLFSGLYPLGGFKFQKNTAFYPLNFRKSFSMDLKNLVHLKSGLFTPSVNFHYFTAAPFRTRERLIYDPEEKSVTNGFEKKIEGVFIKHDIGYFAAGDLSPGEKKELEFISETGGSSQKMIYSFNERFLNDTEAKFCQSSMDIITRPLAKEERIKYIVRFKDNIDSVEQGIKIKSNNNCCILLGLE